MSAKQIQAEALKEARSFVARGLSPTNAPDLAARIASLTDLKLAEAQASGTEVACRKGCSDCCHAPVNATIVEAAAIVEALKRDRTTAELASLVAELRAYVDDLHSKIETGAHQFRRACPLLRGNECSVYETRPLICRGQASWDKEICALWKEGEYAWVLIEGPNGETKIAGEALAGLQEGLGQIGEPLPLAIQVLRVLGVAVQKPKGGRPNWLPEIRPYPLRPDPVVARFERDRETKPMGECLNALTPWSAGRAMASLSVGEGYADQAEHDEVMAAFDSSLQDLEQATLGNATRDAFDALEVAQFVRLGYSSRSPKPFMERVGMMLESQLAKRLAPKLLEPLPKRKPGRARVGIISQHLAEHSATSWALGWLSNFDRQQIETFAIKIGIPTSSTTFEFKEAAERFYVLDGDPLDAAKFVRALDLDYLIYTDLGDGGRNLQMAMFRLARIQAAGWGCPFTSGMPQIDEYLSSDTNEPADADAHYTETLVRLPGNGICYRRPLSPLMHRGRLDFGIADGYQVVIAQNLAKWLPEDDELLLQIAQHPGVQLSVFEFGSPRAIEVFKMRMRAAESQVRYIGWKAYPTYLRMASLFDLSLDAPSFHGGHSSFAFLGAGTPILSLLGGQMRSRMALGFQGRARIPGAVAVSQEVFVSLATQPDWAAQMRKDLDPSPLVGDQTGLRALEARVLNTCS